MLDCAEEALYDLQTGSIFCCTYMGVLCCSGPPELSEGGIWMFNNVDMDMRSTYPVQNFFYIKKHPFCMVLVLLGRWGAAIDLLVLYQ